MFAKSAPQLFATPVRTTSLHLHATLLVVALAIIALATGWLSRDEGAGEPDTPAIHAQVEEAVAERSGSLCSGRAARPEPKASVGPRHRGCINVRARVTVRGLNACPGTDGQRQVIVKQA